MPPKRSVATASKQTIEESFRGTSTRRAYDTYQKQFETFLQANKPGLQAWQQWFVADPGAGLVCALKDYNSDMIRLDRKKYSERLTLASAFEKYQSYEQFEAAYSGYTKSYAKLLRERSDQERSDSRALRVGAQRPAPQ
ncbi:hypothetical protein H257_03429 [Aphanomyces astaci]|uniref:Uncharacterized protein n=1 Tax=Aphanomyces astaci TaxID=112090 RepID=W4GYP6_APHAT|nr:hypothetical protein H257_03429 [Aphanomyces astaci]ETV84119.1 hypothetical protein H257_03429 [Aphanomyces astaci]|eukprot:XP_009825811.1 hypothetical protein H257_03429 [Aphanomyces astaci]